jgi:regulator of sigma E protease
LLSVLAVTGLPKILSNQFSIPGDTTEVKQPVEIVGLVKQYPAENSGLKTGDKIIRFAGQPVPSAAQLISLTKSYRGQTVDVIYTRNNVESTARVALLNNATGSIFGASLGQRELIQATWSAPVVGVVTTGQLTWATLQGLGNMIGNLASGLVLQFSPNAQTRATASSNIKSVSDGVAGPIGILGTIFPQAEKAGATQFVFLTAVISLTLAVMNVLPIPALDGGRWFTMALFKLLKKPLTKSVEEKVQTVGFLLLMGLIVLVTIADVSKIF